MLIKPKMGKFGPREEGYYWAKWRIASEGTVEGDELTPSNIWEIVQVNHNGGEPDTNEEYSVSVYGVQQTQWPDCFIWGPKIAQLQEYEGNQCVVNMFASHRSP